MLTERREQYLFLYFFGSTKTFLCWLYILCFMPAMVLFAAQPAACAAPLSITGVQTNGTVTPDGEQAGITFLLSSDATVSIDIYDPGYTLIRHLVKETTKPGGVINVSWDGRDDAQRIVPNEVYYFTILARNEISQQAFFNSTSDSLAGYKLLVDLQKIVRGTDEYELRFTLPQPARVSLRAGVHEGPLLKTIIDWLPMSAGSHVVLWDGKDDTGRIDVLERDDHVIYLRAMTLPEHAILMQGSTDDYVEYHQLLMSSPIPSTTDGISQSSVTEAALTSGNESALMPEYILRDAEETAAVVMVYDAQDRVIPLGENGTVLVSGTLQMSIEVDPLSQQNFQELRYETVLFIDNVKFDEEENVYAPFIYPLDSTLLSNGRHEISINLVSLSGQIGSYNFTIDVGNN